MSNPVRKIVIVGGGTAGWLTAGIIAAEHNSNQKNGVRITLIESPDIKPIGVGEGTWPTMRHTLQTIGISEKDFIAECDASFKQGSLFVDWHSQNKNESYYHPFVAPHGFGQSDLISYWQQALNNQSFAHSLSPQPHICDANLAPKQLQTPEYAAVLNYGYHLNAGKFSEFLKRHCINKLGVDYIQDNVVSVNGDIAENIESLSLANHSDIAADLFIDCSGQNALLINKHYQIPYVSQKHVLLNDSAFAVQVPYQDQNAPIASHTKSTAHDFGWIWDIGLPSRKGVGCVFSSEHCSDEQALAELKAYLKQDLSSELIEELSIRKLTFNPGHHEKFWHKNCVAVGMAAGFIEPLEASALALVELSAKMISKELPANHAIMPITAKRFNKRFLYRWQRIIDFLKLHYALSERTSPYWQNMTDKSKCSDQLNELLELWKYQEPSFNDFTEIEEIFPAASYQYILYGMGFTTENRPCSRKYENHLISEQAAKEANQLTHKYLGGLPSNRELINNIISLNRNKKVS